ncbi:uncharacterized protein LOC106693745 [Microplitis demolitor]|uniref:uncharacterized protein LOC106693745 n=1 Tax=Microplitis demolitor TaxID=69319 RepID=UPI0006D51AB8|nr:uncharacterized protein LOC106693745 [Microplitis demolitor]
MGETVSDNQIMMKILLTLPPTDRHFVTAWESTAQAERTLTNMVARLTMEETRLGNPVSTSEASGALVAKGGGYYKFQKPKRKGKFNYCGIAGHWKKECRVKARDMKGSGKDENPRRRNQENALIDDMLHTSVDNKKTQNRWCLDSAATSHMSGNKHWFTDLVSLKIKLPIRIGDGKIIYAITKGNINMKAFNGETWRDEYLEDVLFVPKLKCNLFSLSSTTDKGHRMSTDENSCRFTNSESTVAVGERI